MTPILELQDLSFRYEGGLPGEKVLDALTFAVAPGERVGLVGCNGVGKSTLLKVLVGILPIQAGALTVGGLPMERKNLAEIRRKVGYIFQDSDSQLFMPTVRACLLYTSDAADERSSVDLGGRRIIKKKIKNKKYKNTNH